MKDNHLSKQKNKSPKKKRKTEKLSIKDIQDLMRMNMSVYTRKHGAVRRK